VIGRSTLLYALALATATGASAPATSNATVRYTFADRYDLELWAGPTSCPIDAYGGNGGSVDVTVARSADGSFDVRQHVREVDGEGTLDSSYRVVRAGNRLYEVLASQSQAFGSTGLTQRTTDAYPLGRIAFALPLAPRESWSAATRDLTSLTLLETSPTPFRAHETADRSRDGSYIAAVNATNFASTSDVRLTSASTYRLSEAGYNPLVQRFALPVDGRIAVTSSGNPPLPVAPGTVHITSWYPYAGGALTHPLLRDAFRVFGLTKVPSLCGRRARQNATRVDEDGYAVDPIGGTAWAFATDYFLTPDGNGTQLVACVVEQYASGVWANGWAMSAGSWGKLTRLQSGNRVYIADDVPPGARAELARAGLPVVGLDAIAMRRILGESTIPAGLAEALHRAVRPPPCRC